MIKRNFQPLVHFAIIVLFAGFLGSRRYNIKSQIQLISASAGSGKTYRLMDLIQEEIKLGLNASGLLCVTFTKKAAEELKQRIRERLIETGNLEAARNMSSAGIGTVHSICGDLIKRFCFVDGSSPRQKIIDEFESDRLYQNALNEVLNESALNELSELAWKFGISTLDLINDIKKISTLIRQNKLSDLAIDKSIKSSLNKLELITQPSQASSRLENLMKTLETFLIKYPTPPDDTKITTLAHKTIEDIFSDAKNKKTPLPWPLWIKLSKIKAGAKSNDLFSDVTNEARNFISNSELKKDLTQMIHLAFKLAKESSQVFKTQKKNLGVLDYGDLEEKTLSLLDQKSVQEDLKSELEVLFVDEFQDTHPLQLAIFLKLSQLCKKTVWVGDLKQSIYKFRGADQELMKAVIQDVGQGQFEVLNSNWRSTPEIIDFVNEVFSKSFKTDDMEPEQVLQKSQWQHPVPIHGLEVWDGQAKNQNERIERLAQGILSLFKENLQITDRQTEKQRNLKAGDICVLFRTNDEGALLSEKLKKLGLSSSVVSGTLIQLPEIILALAAFRYLINPKDTIAAAEIALNLGVDKNKWLQEALNKSNSENWHPALARLQQARNSMAELSITEKIDLALSVLETETGFEKFSDSENKSFHLSALRQEAKKYEDTCHLTFRACTDLGFIEFLTKNNPPIPSTTHSDAIHILTYHGSKGLEWPLVILASLEKEVRDPHFFEVRQELEKGIQFNARDPLAHRLVTYLPWPFGDHKKVEEIEALTNNHPDRVQLRTAEESETRRLLYVGMTRAREKLILFNTIKKNQIESMLAVLKHEEKSLLEFDSKNAQIIVGQKTFKCLFKNFELIENSTSGHTLDHLKKNNIVLPTRKSLPPDSKPYYLQPSLLTETLVPQFKREISMGRSYIFGENLLYKNRSSLHVEPLGRGDIIGSAVHLYLASAHQELNLLAHANQILRQWNLTKEIDPSFLVAAYDRLQQMISQLWPQAKVFKEVPMEISHEGSIIRGSIDCLVVTDDEIAVIDHKTLLSKNHQNVKDEMMNAGHKYSLQLVTYAMAVQKHFKIKKMTTWIYNPNGWMCEFLF